MPKHHKSNHKKGKFQRGNFNHQFRYGLLATADGIRGAGHTINKNVPLLKPVGSAIESVGAGEQLTVAGLDALGAKNPKKRFSENMSVSF